MSLDVSVYMNRFKQMKEFRRGHSAHALQTILERITTHDPTNSNIRALNIGDLDETDVRNALRMLAKDDKGLFGKNVTAAAIRRTNLTDPINIQNVLHLSTRDMERLQRNAQTPPSNTANPQDNVAPNPSRAKLASPSCSTHKTTSHRRNASDDVNLLTFAKDNDLNVRFGFSNIKDKRSPKHTKNSMHYQGSPDNPGAIDVRASGVNFAELKRKVKEAGLVLLDERNKQNNTDWTAAHLHIAHKRGWQLPCDGNDTPVMIVNHEREIEPPPSR